MPLAFESISHGTVAFGFFNIDSDMLLMEHYFFFADDFCERVGELAQWDGEERFERTWEIYHIPAQRIGDLMGAIHGIVYTGFIGEVYRKFPFPPRPEDFKQKPEGFQTQSEIAEIIAPYGDKSGVPLVLDQYTGQVAISEYRFTTTAFQDLVRYVWVGGYPRWRDNVRPDYVSVMKEQVAKSRNTLFRDFTLEA